MFWRKVKGLTTAAFLWVTAAIGMAVGIGLFLAASLTTVLVFIVLYSKKPTCGRV